MTARMLPRGWKLIGVLAPLAALLALAGCRNDYGSNGGGCCGSGGCCRGSTPDRAPPALAGVSPGASVSAVADGQPSISPTSAKDLYGGQKTCPVTGNKLGSMGPAVAITVQGQTIYVCCRACVAKVQRDPDSYLRKVEAERAAG